MNNKIKLVGLNRPVGKPIQSVYHKILNDQNKLSIEIQTGLSVQGAMQGPRVIIGIHN
jgi:hypothetical protein